MEKKERNEERKNIGRRKEIPEGRSLEVLRAWQQAWKGEHSTKALSRSVYRTLRPTGRKS